MLDYLDSYIADGKKSAAVIFIDIDRFKYVNDTFGHTTGDDLLVEIAHRLRQVIRSEDIVGRLGGDEFIVILTDIKNDPVAWDTANSIIEVLSPQLVWLISNLPSQQALGSHCIQGMPIIVETYCNMRTPRCISQSPRVETELAFTRQS